MADRQTAEEKLENLRELIMNARSMPMSASCVINRGEVLAAIDDVIENLPDEIADAQHVLARSQSRIAEGEAEAGRVLADAGEDAARWLSTVRGAALPRRLRKNCVPTPRQKPPRGAGRRMPSSTLGWLDSNRSCTRPLAR